MSARVNINGSVCDATHAKISVFDHGFLYGDAVYETLRTYGGRPFLFAEHFGRLLEAAACLGFKMRWTEAAMRTEVDRTLEATQLENEWLVRIVVTRGVGEVTPDPDVCSEPALVILVLPLEERPESIYRRGVAITISRLKRSPEIASLKTGNLIHQVLGAREAKSHGALETIFLDLDGRLSDGTRSNIAMVKDGTLLTPSEASGIVRGITRGLVLDMARAAGIEVVEGRFSPGLIAECDEVFLTSTTKGVLPVTRVDGSRVGNGKVGPVTRTLDKAYRSTVERFIAGNRNDPR